MCKSVFLIHLVPYLPIAQYTCTWAVISGWLEYRRTTGKPLNANADNTRRCVARMPALVRAQSDRHLFPGPGVGLGKVTCRPPSVENPPEGGFWSERCG